MSGGNTVLAPHLGLPPPASSARSLRGHPTSANHGVRSARRPDPKLPAHTFQFFDRRSKAFTAGTGKTSDGTILGKESHLPTHPKMSPRETISYAMETLDFTNIHQPTHRRAANLISTAIHELGAPRTAEDLEARSIVQQSHEFRDCVHQAVGTAVLRMMMELPENVFSGDERFREFVELEKQLAELASPGEDGRRTPASDLSMTRTQAMERKKFELAAQEVKKYFVAPSRHPEQAIADVHGLWLSLTERQIPRAPLHCQAVAPPSARTGRVPKRTRIEITPKEQHLTIKAGPERTSSPNADDGHDGSVSLGSTFARPPSDTLSSKGLGGLGIDPSLLNDSKTSPMDTSRVASKYVAFLMTLSDRKLRDKAVAVSQNVLELSVLNALKSSREPDSAKLKPGGKGAKLASRKTSSGSTVGGRSSIDSDDLHLDESFDEMTILEHGAAATKADEARLTVRLEEAKTVQFNELITSIRNDLRYCFSGFDESNTVKPPEPNNETYENMKGIEGLRPSYALPLKKQAVFKWQADQPTKLVKGLHERKEGAKHRTGERRNSAASIATSTSSGRLHPRPPLVSNPFAIDESLSLNAMAREMSQFRQEVNPQAYSSSNIAQHATGGKLNTSSRSPKRNRPKKAEVEEEEEKPLFFPAPPSKAALVAALTKAKDEPHSDRSQNEFDIEKAFNEIRKAQYDAEYEESQRPTITARDPLVNRFRQAEANTMHHGAEKWYEVGRHGVPRVSPRNLHHGPFNLHAVSPWVAAEIKREHEPYLRDDVDDKSEPPTSRDLGIVENRALNFSSANRTQLVQWMY